MKKKLLITIPILLILFSVLFAQTGRPVRLWDTDSTHVATLVWNENDTSNRTFNLTLNSGDRTFALHGNLTVEATSLIDQDLTTDASPIWVTAKLSALTDGYIPYHVSDATGLANSPLWTDGAKVGIGTTTVPHGAVGYAKLAIDGINANAAGPHIQITTNADDFPLMQFRYWSHDNMNIFWDSYYDGTDRSSDVGSNYVINKGGGDLFRIRYDSGIGPGDAITWNEGIVLNTSGQVGFGTDSPSGIAVDGVMLEISGHLEEPGLVIDASGGINKIPIIEMHADRATENGTNGKITFFNNGATPIADITTYRGSTDLKGNLIIRTSNIERMRIDEDGVVTFTQDVYIGGSNKELRFYEAANYVGFEAPALSANQIWILPSSDGSSNEVLTTNGTGTLTWSVKGGGGAATDVFKTINVPAGSNPVASGATDTLNLTSSNGDLTITGNSGTDTIDFDFSSTPSFTSVRLSDLTNGYLPYHVSDASGLANSVIIQSGTDIGIGGSPSTEFHVFGSAATDGVVKIQNDTNTSDVNHGILNLINTAAYAIGNDARIMFTANISGEDLNPLGSIGLIVEGSYQGALQFNTRSGSGAFSEKMRIKATGVIVFTQNSDTLTITGDGTDFTFNNSDGNINFADTIDITGDIIVSGSVDGVDVSALNTTVGLNTTHRGSNGSDHSFINQNVTTTGTPSFTSVSLGTGELTAGSINRGSGTLTLEIGGTAEVSITSTLTTFGGDILADTARLSDLTDGYIPYHVSDATGLADSPIITNGTLVGIGAASGGGILEMTQNGDTLTITGDGTDFIFANSDADVVFEHIISRYVIANEFPAFLTFEKQRAGAIVQNNDLIGQLAFYGWDGGNYDPVAYISTSVSGVPGAGTDMPGRMRFWTTPNGTATPVVSLYLGPEGNVWLDRIPSTDAGDYDLRYDAADGIVYDTSDVRQKSDIQALTYGLDEIMKLSPKRYFYKKAIKWSDLAGGSQFKITEDGYYSIGLIAQEVYNIIPEAVFKPQNQDKLLWGLNKNKLIPVVINAIQEQQAHILSLEVRIEQLEAMILGKGK